MTPAASSSCSGGGTRVMPRTGRLDETTAAVRDELAERHGITTGVVADRLNRRKIDLIPEPEWADPPKARIGELLQAVDRRLSRCPAESGR